MQELLIRTLLQINGPLWAISPVRILLHALQYFLF